MKSLAFAITLLASFGVSAQTVIYYEDGSVYTVQPNEKVYVETAGKIYTKNGYKNGDEYFRHSLPNQKVDYEEQPYDGEDIGSPEWCEAYAPYLYVNGFTFDDQAYIRYCNQDSSGDGEG